MAIVWYIAAATELKVKASAVPRTFSVPRKVLEIIAVHAFANTNKSRFRVKYRGLVLPDKQCDATRHTGFQR